MVAIIRSLIGASRSAARLSSTSTRTQAVLLPRSLHNSALLMAESPNHNSKATGSEASVHAEKHNDDDPATLQKKTAQQAQKNHDIADHKSTHNDVPTQSEDSIHADKHNHDPLPDHKKASKN